MQRDISQFGWLVLNKVDQFGFRVNTATEIDENGWLVFHRVEPNTIEIGGVAVQYEKGSLSVELRVEERSIARFTVIDIVGATSYQRGQPVQIYDNTGDLIFGGIIDTPERFRQVTQGGLDHPIRCIDWHYLADKRLVAESY